MYAMTPWSGYYEYGQEGTDNGIALWTNAHTCQFTQVGWRYLSLGSGAGVMPGGGSFVTLVSPDSRHFTLVAEKLEGRCLRCAGQTTSSETVTFKLAGAIAHVAGPLQLWTTNRTHRFNYAGNLSAAADGSFSVAVQKDSVVTVSSWFNGQKKGAPSAHVPPGAAFPLPHADDFDGYAVDGQARFFADNGGSFQVAADPTDPAGKNLVVKQWAKHENGVNRWGSNVPPVSLIGNTSWADVTVSASVLLDGAPEPGPAPAPTPAPPPGPQYVYFQNEWNRECVDVNGRATAEGSAVDTWSCVTADNERFAYDADTGQIQDKNSGKCVVAGRDAAGARCRCLRRQPAVHPELCGGRPVWRLGADRGRGAGGQVHSQPAHRAGELPAGDLGQDAADRDGGRRGVRFGLGPCEAALEDGQHAAALRQR